MKVVDKLVWLEKLANKYDTPLSNIMIAWVVYDAITRPEDSFEEVLDKVFKD